MDFKKKADINAYILALEESSLELEKKVLN